MHRRSYRTDGDRSDSLLHEWLVRDELIEKRSICYPKHRARDDRRWLGLGIGAIFLRPPNGVFRSARRCKATSARAMDRPEALWALVQAAYRRTTYLGTPDKPGERVRLIGAWGTYCGSASLAAKVVPLPGAVRGV